MPSEYDATIAALERKLNEIEQAARKTRVAINAVLELKGDAPRFPTDGGGGGGTSGTGGAVDEPPAGGGAPLEIKSDTFFGKKLSTAMREFLTMRRAKGDGPAAPREIFEALKQGGYKYEAKTDEIALVSIRAMLRKNTPTFTKVGGGRYGLTAWYPEMRRPRTASPVRGADDGEGELTEQDLKVGAQGDEGDDADAA